MLLAQDERSGVCSTAAEPLTFTKHGQSPSAGGTCLGRRHCPQGCSSAESCFPSTAVRPQPASHHLKTSQIGDMNILTGCIRNPNTVHPCRRSSPCLKDVVGLPRIAGGTGAFPVHFQHDLIVHTTMPVLPCPRKCAVKSSCQVDDSLACTGGNGGLLHVFDDWKRCMYWGERGRRAGLNL